MVADHRKVFVIGSNKTGTTSLAKALVELGYSVAPEDLIFDKDSTILAEFQKGSYEGIFSVISQYDAFEDRPYNHTDFYKTLDAKFEDSKFILTIRDTESWIRSYRRWSEKVELKKQWFYGIISQTCYGVDDFLLDEALMRSKYQERNEAVERYFEGTGRLLVMDVEKGDGWNVLCPFLSKSFPVKDLVRMRKEFPHLNKTK